MYTLVGIYERTIAVRVPRTSVRQPCRVAGCGWRHWHPLCQCNLECLLSPELMFVSPRINFKMWKTTEVVRGLIAQGSTFFRLPSKWMQRSRHGHYFESTHWSTSGCKKLWCSTEQHWTSPWKIWCPVFVRKHSFRTARCFWLKKNIQIVLKAAKETFKFI